MLFSSFIFLSTVCCHLVSYNLYAKLKDDICMHLFVAVVHSYCRCFCHWYTKESMMYFLNVAFIFSTMYKKTLKSFFLNPLHSSVVDIITFFFFAMYVTINIKSLITVSMFYIYINTTSKQYTIFKIKSSSLM